ncbi:MAG: B12-binding domain-containing radical SAM protein [Candidatus Merdivicinus sp.]|jgi:radical SAM superfamily enzyme YgiQ (UPF0313 family)
MNILLAGISAKYIHSTLAVHLLRRYALEQYGITSQTAEFTINQYDDFILSEIYRLSPDLLGFSCYIWNYGQICRLIPALKKILPDTKIFVGGPEVSFEPQQALTETGADFVLSGEGEEPFSHLCLAAMGKESLADVPSLGWYENDIFHQNAPAKPLDLARLPFVYEDLQAFENRILYYEAQRGCPFNCQYCLSSVDKGVRFQPLDKVKRELQIFLDARVPQVKFVDRTFNTNAHFALEIWRYLAEHDNGVTNFHFEMEADLITEEQLTFLETVRPGLFQFEIGVQSVNPATLNAVDRHTNLEKLAGICRRIRQNHNIHLHLDLIAGLPYENYDSFGNSFDWVYALHPDQFQLGFLKLLKGSGLRKNASQYGILWRDEPPYEVLATNVMPYSDLLRLKDIEALTEQYENSRRFEASLAYLVPLESRPFLFYENFSRWYRQQKLFDQPHTKLDQYDILYRYGCTLPGCDPEILGWRMRYDLYSHEKCKKLPIWLPNSDSPALRETRLAFFRDSVLRQQYLPEYEGLDPKQVEKMAHLDFFPFDPMGESRPTVYLFNYRRHDILGKASAFCLDRSIFYHLDATVPLFPDTI